MKQAIEKGYYTSSPLFVVYSSSFTLRRLLFVAYSSSVLVRACPCLSFVPSPPPLAINAHWRPPSSAGRSLPTTSRQPLQKNALKGLDILALGNALIVYTSLKNSSTVPPSYHGHLAHAQSPCPAWARTYARLSPSPTTPTPR